MLGDLIKNGFFGYDPFRYSPWGRPQQVYTVAPGIVEVSTSRHGGVAISVDRYNEMPLEARGFHPFAGTGWYEEDCDWVIPFLCFHAEYAGYHARRLLETENLFHATAYKDGLKTALQMVKENYFEGLDKVLIPLVGRGDA